MFDNQFRVCPDECLGEVAYPAIPKDQDCTSFPIYESQVCGLVILPFGAPLPNDWKTKPPWSGSIDNSAAGNSTGKWLRGTGSVGIPQKLDPVFGRIPGTAEASSASAGNLFKVTLPVSGV